MVNGSLKRTREVHDSSDDDQPEIPTLRTKTSRRDDVERPNDGDDDNDITSLLDFTSSSSHDEVSTRFDSISNALLSEYHLSIINVHDSRSQPWSRTNYEILELEFYLQKPGCHEDPFTHGSAEQERGGQWYFHRAPKRWQGHSTVGVTAAGGYRGGTRKGLDLTLGNPVRTKTSPSSSSVKSFLRGGALLRTIRRCHDQKIISGPSLLVDEILRRSGASSINELVSDKWKGDISALSVRPNQSRSRSTWMYLCKRPTSTTTTTTTSRIYRSPRIGLDLSNPESKAVRSHPRVVFVGKRYRYLTHPELLTANGRCQTFVGLYLFLASGVDEGKKYEPNSDKFRHELSGLMGTKDATIVKYLTDYRFGFEKGKLESFVGVSGKGVSGSTSTYLKMMGTLARTLAHEA